MLIGVVSDTHGHVPNTLDAIRMLEPFEVEAVLHCGDIGSSDIPPLFTRWPTHYVFGNVDRNEPELRESIQQAGARCHERFGALSIAEVEIAFLHSDDTRRFQDTVNCGKWDLVCYGHTHRAEHHQAGSTLVLNPGAVYRARPHSVAVVELPSRQVTMLEF